MLLSCGLVGEKDEESDPEPVVERLRLHVKVSLCRGESADMTAMTSPRGEASDGRQVRGPSRPCEAC